MKAIDRKYKTLLNNAINKKEVLPGYYGYVKATANLHGLNIKQAYWKLSAHI